MSSPNPNLNPLGRCAICGGTALPDPDNLCKAHEKAQVVRDRVSVGAPKYSDFPQDTIPHWEYQTLYRSTLSARGVTFSARGWLIEADDILRRRLRQWEYLGWRWGWNDNNNGRAA